jgi:O-antigen/teichoic acid export membrane protein
VITAVLFVLAARHIEPKQFGIVAGELAVAGVVALIVDVGASPLVVRAGGLSSHELRWRGLTFFPRASLGMAGVVLLIIAWLLAGSSMSATDVAVVVGYTALVASLASVETFASSALVANRSTRQAVALLSADRTVGLATLVVAGAGINWTAGLMASQIATYLPALAALRPIRNRIKVREHASGIAADRFSFTFAALAGQIQNLEVPVVAVVSGSVQAAYMGLASRLTGPLSIATSSGSSLLLRQISAPAPASHVTDAALLRLVGAVSAMPLVVIAVLPARIYQLVLPQSYLAGLPALRLVLITVAVNAFVQPAAALLQRDGRTRVVAKVIAVSGAIGLAGCAIGAWFGGAAGGATGMLVGQVVQFGCYTWLRRPQTESATDRAVDTRIG